MTLAKEIEEIAERTNPDLVGFMLIGETDQFRNDGGSWDEDLEEVAADLDRLVEIGTQATILGDHDPLACKWRESEVMAPGPVLAWQDGTVALLEDQDWGQDVAVHVFPSREAASSWIDQLPETEAL